MPSGLGRFLFAWALIAFPSEALWAKRSGPVPVVPIVYLGVRYEAPPWGSDVGIPQNGGIVEAYDVRTNAPLWRKIVYHIHYDPDMEDDVQDVFITSLRIRGNDLIVSNERGREFAVDLSSHEVRELAFTPPASRGAKSTIDYSKDQDVQALSQTEWFAFGPVGLSGKRVDGEATLARILKRDNVIRALIYVYNKGTPGARVYALAAFHFLAPQLFAQCRRDLVGGYNPIVKSMAGCVSREGNLLEFLIRIQDGEYDSYVRKYSEEIKEPN